jgi:acetylornithine deacetylase
MLARSVRKLRDYVAIPSVNPMQRDDLDPSIAGERRYAEQVREDLRRLGLDAELVGDAQRPSVIAEARAPGATDTVLVASHLDTVPVDGMQIDPFDPRIEQGRLYGRGSCDTKGGMAALVDALGRVLERGSLRRNVIAVGEADEEFGSAGVLDVLARLGTRAREAGVWVIATEPTSLQIVTRHKGVVHARLRASGVACHSSDPSAGRNAIVGLARAILAVDDLGAELSERKDPKLGPATLSVGMVDGGAATNIVPDAASAVIDRRLLPGESDATVRAELEAALERAHLDDVEVDWCELRKAPLETPDDHPAVRACQRALGAAGLPIETGIAAFGTDAGVLAAHGLPGVVLGPGSIAQAHTSREWVEVAQVESMADFLTRLFETPA